MMMMMMMKMVRKMKMSRVFTACLICLYFVVGTEAGDLNITSDYYTGDDHDYEFYDESSIPHFPIEDNPPLYQSNFTYKKCFCDIQQVWNGQECIHLDDPQIILTMLEVLQPTSEKFLSFMLSKVDIGNNISCAEPKQLVTAVDERLYIVDNGELYHQTNGMYIPHDSYCFEFELNESLQIISTIAKVCLPPPNIPYCCNDANCNVDVVIDPLSVYWGETKVNWTKYNLQKTKAPSCGNSNHFTQWAINESDSQIAFFQDHDRTRMDFIDATPGIMLKPLSYSSSDFCILNNGTNALTLKFCYNDPVDEHNRQCKTSSCFRKCCPPGQSIDHASHSCSSLVNDTDFNLPFNRSEKPEEVLMEYGYPWCGSLGSYTLSPLEEPVLDEFYLLSNGSIFIPSSNAALPPSKYCIDNFVDQNGAASMKAICCFLEKESDICKEVHDILHPFLMVVSCIFLSITLTVYTSIPELRIKLHGKCLLSHVSSLVVAFLCQLIDVWGYSNLTMSGCKVIALAKQVSFLWAFFWLNVMCFDIWWTLKSMNPSPETGDSIRRRFLLYSVYAWGTPLLISFITGIMEFFGPSVQQLGLIWPGFGIKYCWFKDEASTWIFFHGYTLLLCVINILFFFHVAAILIQGQRSTEGILRRTRKQQQERVYLYLKLFIVMGITWICEVASWKHGSCSYWFFTDIINSLQGVFIFFIFMCNKKIYEKIHAKGMPLFRRMKTIVRTPSSMASVERRTSSQRTTQTSLESSSRRLSNSIPISDIPQLRNV